MDLSAGEKSLLKAELVLHAKVAAESIAGAEK
jgi:hypothetical protein